MKSSLESVTVGTRNGEEVQQQAMSGFVSGATSGVLSTVAGPIGKSMKGKVLSGTVIGTISGIVGGLTDGNNRFIRKIHDGSFGAGSGMVNSLIGILADGVKQEPQDISDYIGIGWGKYFAGVPDFAIGCISMLT